MAVTRIKRVVVFNCDDCQEEYWSGTDDFREAVDDIKHQRWLVTYEDGQWKHYCKECRG